MCWSSYSAQRPWRLRSVPLPVQDEAQGAAGGLLHAEHRWQGLVTTGCSGAGPRNRPARAGLPRLGDMLIPWPTWSSEPSCPCGWDMKLKLAAQPSPEPCRHTPRCTLKKLLWSLIVSVHPLRIVFLSREPGSCYNLGESHCVPGSVSRGQPTWSGRNRMMQRAKNTLTCNNIMVTL